MRINHLIKTFKNEKLATFNRIKHDHTYLVQFDDFGEEVLKKIILKNNPSSKVLIGPLFDIQMDKKLNEYIKKYNFIKKIVASNSSLEYQKTLYGEEFLKDVFVIPAGIDSEKNLNTKQTPTKVIDCLIYFKKRKDSELNMLLDFLENKNLDYKVLKYGHYKNKTLEKLAKKSSFGIILDKTESQGFAIQKIMSTNLPLIVWDYKINNYEGYDLVGTSVPFWDDTCGIKIDSEKELKENFDNFINKLDLYSPIDFVKNNLTYESFAKNIFDHFSDENNWSN